MRVAKLDYTFGRTLIVTSFFVLTIGSFLPAHASSLIDGPSIPVTSGLVGLQDAANSLLSGTLDSNNPQASRGTQSDNAIVSGSILSNNQLASESGLTITTSAVDGSGRIIQNFGFTTSQSIILSFTAVGSDATDSNLRFMCSLDNNPATFCTSPQAYNNLVSGQIHFIIVQAVSDQRSATTRFQWTIGSPNSSGQTSLSEAAQSSALISAKQPVQSDIRSNQQFLNDAQTLSTALQQRSASAALQDATDQAATLNPILKPCDPVKTTMALYTVRGRANLEELLQGESGKIPVRLIIFADQRPVDLSNQIVNNNQPFIKAVLVSNPGNIDKQKSINYEITKIDTECINKAFVEKPQEIQSDTPGSTKLATVSQYSNLNHIFEYCITATGNTQRATQTVGGGGAGGTGSIGGTIPPAVRGTLSNAPITGDTRGFSTALDENANVALSGSNPAALSVLQPNPSGGFPVDVARYTVEGTIDSSVLPLPTGTQDTVFKIFNIMNPTTQPQTTSVTAGDSNSRLLAAKIELNPGDTDDGDWRSFDFILGEISTVCNSIPFVSAPLAIGIQQEDYYSWTTNSGG